ncbi:putative S-adenosylmethionine-dependent methyltransferase CRG1 [Podospora fimiseda]|uniref:S-adenosylmethionine-dependent methyltransferase CRG1 n=1 Tax=Podospora fimiseda TaxID=252190 RepID=A0AAN7BNM1_9PEZI|nr:putative S-adenosylmethionine-dependent methyltransferase CRG1 [Podospora fimiseda]
MTLFTGETVSSNYADFRPTYPQSLYDLILTYHGPSPRDTFLDLGTVDPSPGMISRAEQLTSQLPSNNIILHESPAESLPFIPSSSADLVVSGEAAHWLTTPNYGLNSQEL